MRARARVAAVSFVAACITTLATAAPAGEIAALDKRWRWVESERFQVLTNGSERRARQVIEELTAYRSAIRQMMGGETGDPPTPIRIVQFDRVWDFAPYQVLDAAGKPETFAGYFLSRGDLHYFALSNESRDDVPRTVLTGYAHVLIGRQVGSLPTWLRTGLAHYLSAYRYIPREHRAEIGRPIPENMRYLNASTHFPLERILTMDYDSPEFALDVPRSLFYAKSWLLVHYLQLGSPERAGTLARFAKLRAEGVEDLAALEQAAGCSLRQLDDELTIYQRKSLMNLQSVELSEDPRGAAIQVRPAARGEVAFRLGEYLDALGPERRSEAEAHFAASGQPAPTPAIAQAPPGELVAPTIRAVPTTPPPSAMPTEPADDRSLDQLHAVVAAGNASANDRELFAARVRELAARDSQGARVHLALARQALREQLVATPRRAGVARQLSALYKAEPEPADRAEGLAALEAAFATAPDEIWLLTAWGELLLATGDTDRARAKADLALASPSPESDRSGVEYLLIQIDADSARRLRDQGQGEEGRRLLEDRLAASTYPASREFARHALEAFRGSLAEDAIEAKYRAAVALVNAQKVEQGAQALRDFIAAYSGSMWAEVARQDLEKVEAYLAQRRARSPSPPAPPPS